MLDNKMEFVETMEALFGSDEALGVWFSMDDGSRLTLAEHDALYARLGPAMPGGCSMLANGGSAVCCTDYAAYIYQTLPGRVEMFGFANEDNPTSRVAREEMHPGGHDYAVVDGRYIVDPWPRLVPGEFEQMVFDLQDPAEAALARDIYGPASCWTRMLKAEHYAKRPIPQILG